jgi:amino acid transporter
MATLAEPVVHGKQVVSQLKTNTLNLFDATIIATSSVAPAYSLAATIAYLFVVVGIASPAAILVSFFPVMFIALAYYYLNRMDPNCGASYSWVSRTLSPYIGWFGGWVQLCANVLFCAAAPLVAGAYTLQLLNSWGWISSDTAGSQFWTAAVGVLWLLFVTYMVVKGIRLTANFQWVLLAIEYFIVVGFCIAAFVKVIGGHPATQPVQLSWFNPGSLHNIDGLAAGAALGVFFFWGWDTAANVNEESKDAETTPGYAGLISMVVLLVLFLFAATAIDMVTSAANLTTIGNNGGDILYFFAQSLSGAPITYLMVLAVLSSTVATVQTTLLPSSRLSFSMARDGVFPKMFSVVHKSWQTPWIGTLVTTILSILVIASTFIGSVNNAFGNLILEIGVLVAFYYGITGISCAWAFRKVLLTSPSLFLLAGLLPIIGGIFLFWIGYEVVFPPGVAFGDAISTAAPVLITFGIGIPLTVIAALVNKNGFFKEKTVSYIRKNGQLMAQIRGGPTLELAGAAAALTTPGATVDPASVVDPATQTRSNNE